MKLHEIIDTIDNETLTISYETIHPYLNSLYIYYKDYHCSEPVLLVDTVMNAVQYITIVPESEFNEIVTERYKLEKHEEIFSNSRMLKDLID